MILCVILNTIILTRLLVVWMPKNTLIQFGIMACFINYILHYLIYTGDSCIIDIPSLTLCRMVIHKITFALMLLGVPGKAVSDHLCSEYGIRLGDSMYNCSAWANDISLYYSTVTGLKPLIDICAVYPSKWRFNFGIKRVNV